MTPRLLAVAMGAGAVISLFFGSIAWVGFLLEGRLPLQAFTEARLEAPGFGAGLGLFLLVFAIYWYKEWTPRDLWPLGLVCAAAYLAAILLDGPDGALWHLPDGILSAVFAWKLWFYDDEDPTKRFARAASRRVRELVDKMHTEAPVPAPTR